MIPKKLLCLSIVLASTSGLAIASENSDEYREHGTHEHGAAEMSVALIDGELTINLNTPAYNILGFEHAPSTDEQIKHVEQQFAQLEQAQALFAIPKNAACSLQKFELESPFEEHSHDEHEHEEEHAEHDHEHDHDHEEGETHSDIRVSYHYSCEDLAAVNSVDMSGLFEHFKNLEKLNVSWLDAESQSAATLTPENARLTLE